ncbi:response regulator transcription factor [Dyadobacter luticola]|uniref:Response regulator transcription factor n=1 Tax=Dyadobacter luticola TaxID=1979387 RepID=A0A5R9KYU3_9BACT|nr:response regulator transcription factor [Dyadobacter luticola]TLV01444.1 response regulator transcription factor [Dyadobacter luticola]
MKILVVEDEEKLADFMVKGLQQAGYLVVKCDSGTEALNKVASENFDLILLDLMLPGANGLEVLKNMRAFNISIPVIIVSALSGTAHVVEGLDLGAVDYIKKPFDWEELLARIRTVQRIPSAGEKSKINVGELSIDLAARKVTREGKDFNLTAKEFILLEYLARNANRVVSKNQILENVWQMDFDPESNIVEVFMYQLRKKIDRGFAEQMVETVIGVGYSLKGTKAK